MSINKGISIKGHSCKIRHVNDRDISEVYNIELKSFKYPYPLHLFIIYLKLFPELFLVVECENRVVGYGIAVIEPGKTGHIVSIAIDPKYRGLGLGKALMKELEGKLKTYGAMKVKLEVSVNNNIAINLYKSLGYKITKRMSRYYPDGSDAYVMIKNLT